MTMYDPEPAVPRVTVFPLLHPVSFLCPPCRALQRPQSLPNRFHPSIFLRGSINLKFPSIMVHPIPRAFSRSNTSHRLHHCHPRNEFTRVNQKARFTTALVHHHLYPLVTQSLVSVHFRIRDTPQTTSSRQAHHT